MIISRKPLIRFNLTGLFNLTVSDMHDRSIPYYITPLDSCVALVNMVHTNDQPLKRCLHKLLGVAGLRLSIE